MGLGFQYAPWHIAIKPAQAQAGSADNRKITFNDRAATASDFAILAQFEKAWGVQIPSGNYWYDAISGAAGQWGGPTRGFLYPGLALGGGTVPANASGGGQGNITGVFINGREIHPLDAQGLTSFLGQPPWPGRWWVDGQGNFGLQGQPPIGNLLMIANQRRSGGSSSYYRRDAATGSSTFVGSGCTSVSGRTRSSDSSSSYSYFVGC